MSTLNFFALRTSRRFWRWFFISAITEYGVVTLSGWMYEQGIGEIWQPVVLFAPMVVLTVFGWRVISKHIHPVQVKREEHWQGPDLQAGMSIERQSKGEQDDS